MKQMSLISVLLIAVALALPAAAQSDETAKHFHFLPHIADGKGWQSTLLVTNVAQSASACTLQLYGLGVNRFEHLGSVQTSGSTATFNLPGAGAYLTWPTRNLSPEASGYATLDCTEPVVAQVIFASIDSSGKPTGMATVFSSQAGRVFQLPVLTPEPGLGFAIANDTAALADCRIVLQDPQGGHMGEASLSVSSKTNWSGRLLNQLISFPSNFRDGTATVSCTQPVAMVGLHFETQTNGEPTFSTLPPAVVVPSSQSSDETAKRFHFLPHIADGGGWRSTLLVTSVAQSASQCTLQMIGLDVDRFGGHYAGSARNVQGGRNPTATFDLPGAGDYLTLRTTNQAVAASGYATLDCTEPVVAQVIFASIDSSGKPTGMATVFSSQAGRVFQLPVLTPEPGLGFAIANDTLALADCRIVLQDPQGGHMGEASLSVSSKTNWSGRLLNQLISFPSNFRDGTATVSCTQPVAMVGLHFETQTNGEPTFSTLPPTVIESVASSERGALMALYNSTGGPNWTRSHNWGTSAPLDQWHGVVVHPATGHLIQISLRNNNLRGRIPPEIGDLANLEALYLSANELTGPIPPEIGGLVNLQAMFLDSTQLTGQIPEEIGNLFNLRVLALNDNQLEGVPPSQVGNLGQLQRLELQDNPGLSGPLPQTLTGLGQLQLLAAENTGLCVANDSRFRNWLASIGNYRIRYCAAAVEVVSGSDQQAVAGKQLPQPVIVRAVDARGVPVLGVTVGFSPEQGHGTANPDVTTTDGRGWAQTVWTLGPTVGTQALTANAAEGSTVRVSATATTQAASVGAIETVSGGGQSGNAGVALQGQVVVRVLDTARAPIVGATVVFQSGEGHGTAEPPEATTDASGQARTTWTLGLGDIEQTLTVTAGNVSVDVDARAIYSERKALEALYHAMGGPNWTNKRNWLTDASLDQWFGVSADQAGRVESLVLANRGLSGRIPPAVGALWGLQTLILDVNDITGPIPPELGRLHRLEVLGLNNNRLSGEIPPELGNLSRLRVLRLSSNTLRGKIPAELTNLSDLTGLVLSHNHLEGRIPGRIWVMDELRLLNLAGNLLEGSVPASLGELANLEHLILSNNDLSGPLPVELGQLRSLKTLALGNNRFSGAVPEEFSRLRQLRYLELHNNPGLAGTLSGFFVGLNLERLRADGTGICLPQLQTLSRIVRRWLDSISDLRLRLCGDGQALAYLTQAIQDPRRPIPLIAGEDALLRVFMTTVMPGTRETIPPVRAEFFVNGQRVHETRSTANPGRLQPNMLNATLDQTANAAIPGRVIQPGLEIVVEIDPDGTLDPALGVPRRFPVVGRAAVEVSRARPLHLRFVPFVYKPDNDRKAVATVEELTPKHELLEDINYLLPVGTIRISKHPPIETDTRNPYKILRYVQIAQRGKGKPFTGPHQDAYWMGMLSYFSAKSGLAYLGRRISVASTRAGSATMAHELGHNFGLRHAPCGNPDNVDPNFPHPKGQIGSWGYAPSSQDGGRLVSPRWYDLMSYCSPEWISGYSFKRALRVRGLSSSASSAVAEVTTSLLVSGGVTADGTPYLDPAFVMQARPTVPHTPGPYRLKGRRAGGSELFSIAFDMPEIADGDGGSVFVFALPVETGWDSELASLVLSGPSSTFEMRDGSEPPMVIARDPATGEVRAILHNVPDLPPGARAQSSRDALALETDLDVMISRGIPSAEDWSR